MGYVIFSLIDVFFVYIVFVGGLFFLPRSIVSRTVVYSLSLLFTILFFMSDQSFRYDGGFFSQIIPIASAFVVGWLFFLPVHMVVGFGNLLDSMRGEGFADQISPLLDDGESTLGKLAFFYMLGLYATQGELHEHVNFLFELALVKDYRQFDGNEQYVDVAYQHLTSILKYYFLVAITFLFIDFIVALTGKINPKMPVLAFAMPIKSVILYVVIGIVLFYGEN